MKRGIVCPVMSLVLALGAVAYGQIIGGAEQAKFELGDVTLFADDFSSVPIGEPSPNFKLMQGTYEIVQFQGKKWLRPLAAEVELVKPLQFPNEFSLEITFCYLGSGDLYVYLLPAEGVANWRSYGTGRFADLRIARYSEEQCNVGLRLSVPMASLDLRDVVVRGFKAGSHKVALQVRRQQIRLFVDGQRIAVAPFNPEKPVAGLGFRYDGINPDKPLLLTDLRVATYSRRELAPGKGGTAQLLLVMDKTKLEEKHPLREALKKFGAVELDRGWWLPLPAEPFGEPGTWQVNLDIKAAEQWSKRLKEILSQVKQLQPDAHLLVEGFAPEVAEAKEKPTEFWGRQLEFWLAALRAKVLAIWLIHFGFAPEDLRTAP
ncbi:MAG: hypothetical protein ACK4I8_01015 [Armatimonadota bacterium]